MPDSPRPTRARETYTATMRPELLVRLDACAKSYGLDRAQMIEDAVELMLNREDRELARPAKPARKSKG